MLRAHELPCHVVEAARNAANARHNRIEARAKQRQTVAETSRRTLTSDLQKARAFLKANPRVPGMSAILPEAFEPTTIAEKHSENFVEVDDKPREGAGQNVALKVDGTLGIGSVSGPQGAPNIPAQGGDSVVSGGGGVIDLTYELNLLAKPTSSETPIPATVWGPKPQTETKPGP